MKQKYRILKTNDWLEKTFLFVVKSNKRRKRKPISRLLLKSRVVAVPFISFFRLVLKFHVILLLKSFLLQQKRKPNFCTNFQNNWKWQYS